MLKNALVRLDYLIVSIDEFQFLLFHSRSRLIDGTEVIFETCERKQQLHDESPRRGPDETPTGHHDCITDIAMTKIPQNFLISSSRDGVIKVWK